MFELTQSDVTNIMKGIRHPEYNFHWTTPSEAFVTNRHTGGYWWPERVELSADQIARGVTASFVEIDMRKAPVFLLIDPASTEYQHLGILVFNVGRQDFYYAPTRLSTSVHWLTYNHGFDLAHALVETPIRQKANFGLSVLKKIITPSPAA